MNYSMYSIDELEEMALEGDTHASEELNKRYASKNQSDNENGIMDTEEDEQKSLSMNREESSLKANSEETSYIETDIAQDNHDNEEEKTYDNETPQLANNGHGFGQEMQNKMSDSANKNEIANLTWKQVIQGEAINTTQNPKGLGIKDINSINTMPLIQLMDSVEHGDPFAMYAVGKKKMAVQDGVEMGEGLKMMMLGVNTLKNHYANDEISKEKLGVLLSEMVSEYMELLDADNRSDIIILDGVKYDFSSVLKECIFTLASNAYELDNSKVEELIRCYEDGIGCIKDHRKAMVYIEQLAESKHTFLNCIRAFAGYAIKEQYLFNEASLDASYWQDWSVKSTLWAQKTLECEDASKHPKLVARLKLWLSEYKQTDSQGKVIDYESQLIDYNSMSIDGLSKDDLYYLYLFSDPKERVQFANRLFDEKYNNVAEYNCLRRQQEEADKSKDERNKAILKEKRSKTIRTILIIIMIVGVVAFIVLNPDIYHMLLETAGTIISIAVVLLVCYLCASVSN